MKKLLLVLLAVLALSVAVPLSGQENFLDGWDFSTDFGFGIQYPPAGYMQANFTESLTKSFSDDPIFPLTLSNFGKVNVTPVTLDYTAGASFTPIALLVLDVNAMIGTGWNALDNAGLAVLRDDGYHDIYSFVFNTAVKATLQFDFAVIWPGDWSHVVVQTGHEFRYRTMQAAADGQPWIYQTTEYINGWEWNGSAVLGYQFPAIPVLNMIALQAEFGQCLGDPVPSRKDWNLFKLTGAVFLDVTESFQLTLAGWYDYNGSDHWAVAVQGSVNLL
ncbi:MAG: hypothetical protein LBM77_08345 [Spirochaetaceae bacterium]|jgi:hypothetical protein|nr:hypothetical protein [Spirochaetaceae bacterium]